MDGLTVMAAVVAAVLVGMVVGVKLDESAWRKAGKRREKDKRKRISTSHVIAVGVLFVDATATYFVLYLCRLAIITQYEGALPYLTTLIGALQAATGYVLGHYFKKATAENTAGGITYDAALGTSGGTTATEEEAQG